MRSRRLYDRFSRLERRKTSLTVYFAALLVLGTIILFQTKRSPNASHDVDIFDLWSKSRLRPLIYMTTQFSAAHARALKCWKVGIAQNYLLQISDLLILTSKELVDDDLEYLKGFKNLRVEKFQESGGEHSSWRQKQRGAINAMVLPFLETNRNWFDGYDWVIRLNPDVFILNETWILRAMADPSAAVLGINCKRNPNTTKSLWHTDFIAFRPEALSYDAFVKLANDTNHAERHVTNSLVASGLLNPTDWENMSTETFSRASRILEVEGAYATHENLCRVTRGDGSDPPTILHQHGEQNTSCPYL